MNNEKLITVRLPADLLARVDELVPALQQVEDFSVMRLTRSAVIRLAILRGLASLEEDYAE